MTQTEQVGERFYIDCEFDGHNGPLLSVALVAEDGRSVHIETDVKASDPWVVENVVPLMDKHDATDCTRVSLNAVGDYIRWFLEGCERPIIVADSPVDIGRFCRAISTGSDGEWASADFPQMTFEVHNVDCYPTRLEGAVQHNAWWDAMSLRTRLASPSPEQAEMQPGAECPGCKEVVFDEFRKERDGKVTCGWCGFEPATGKPGGFEAPKQIVDDEDRQAATEKALQASPEQAVERDKEEEVAYQIGKEEGFSDAVQRIDLLTGGDGEYRWSSLPDRNCPDPETMIAGIVERFKDNERPALSASLTAVAELVSSARALADDSTDDCSAKRIVTVDPDTFDRFCKSLVTVDELLPEHDDVVTALATLPSDMARAVERAAIIAECHADDRLGRDRPMDWHDGYMDGCKGAAVAIRAALAASAGSGGA